MSTLLQTHLISINHDSLRKKPLLKIKMKGLKNSSGRNNTGKITSYHRGGGHKQKYRSIDFVRRENTVEIVTSIEYDPNRTANIASTYNIVTRRHSYIVAPENLKVGNVLKSGSNADVSLGHSLPLSKIPEGSFIYNVSDKVYGSAKISRSAGTFSNILEKSPTYSKILLPSGKQRKLPINCYASIGVVSNGSHINTIIGKAGKSRWLNKRPSVRGVAMNPIDHPNGGGEGRKSGKNATPWGKPSNCGKTSTSKIKNEKTRE
jgi:large subunit ribosomal protein L2